MKRLIAVLALVGLAACSRSGAGSEGASPSGRHAWTRPGILRMASLDEPDTLNPVVGNYQIDVDLSMFWGGYLFKVDDTGALVPELAVSEPTLANGGIAKDGRTITYHLRDGVQWQDGKPFTARDVVFTWHAVMNPRNNVGTRQGYDLITRIDTPDPHTAIVHLKAPYAPFVNTFFAPSGQPYPILPEHLLAQFPDINRVAYNAKPVGTGPFIVQEWHRGSDIRMVANPHYWRGAPKLKEVRYRIIPDENTLITTVKTHETDFWHNASTANLPQVKDIAGTRAILTPFTRYSLIGFNMKHPPLDDVRVRRALAMAVDRKRLLEQVSFGANTLGEGDQPSFLWAYDKTLAPIPYDPQQANALLDAAGWRRGPDGMRSKDGRPLHLDIAEVSGNRIGALEAVQFQSLWRAIGVDLGIRNYTSSLYLASYGAGGILQNGKFDVAGFSWINGVDPDDSFLVLCSQKPPAGQNVYAYCNPHVDAAEHTALTSYDRAVRAKAYATVQQALVRDVPFFTLWFNRQLDVVNVDVTGYKPAHAVATIWNPEQLDI